MIAWSIAAARDSGLFDRIIVSTDDAEIAEVSLAHGASVPFQRPAALADDLTGMMPVVAHAIEWHRTHGATPTEVCCLYATAPFVTAEDLQRGFAVLADGPVDYALAVTDFAFPIQRAVRLSSEGRLAMFQPEHFVTRSQDLEPAFHDAGQFCWGLAEAWLSGRPVFSAAARPVMLPRCRVQDIDTFEDWLRAEWLFRAWQAERTTS
jgi:N-acylneuraminate cytidylyltransferase